MTLTLQMSCYQHEWREAELDNDELKNYKAKAEYYIRQHQDHMCDSKIKNQSCL